MNWLITGGCGFIGTSLISYILENNPQTRIRVLDNLSVGTREDLAEVAEFIELGTEEITSNPVAQSSVPCQLLVGDIRDQAITQRAAEGIDVIVHLAANTGVGPSVENPRLDCETNVIGTFNMLEAARTHHVKRFVFASSGAPVGEVEPPIHEELAAHPVSPYGASKLAGEGYCSAYYRSFGIETVALRFGNVFGPRSKNKASVVAKFIKQALNGETLEVYGDGTQTRDYIYITDLVRAIILAASRDDVGGEIFQIATSRETSLNELLEMLTPVLADTLSEPVEVRYDAPRLGDVKRNFSDTSKAATQLGWLCETPLQQGLASTVSYFLDSAH